MFPKHTPIWKVVEGSKTPHIMREISMTIEFAGSKKRFAYNCNRCHEKTAYINNIHLGRDVKFKVCSTCLYRIIQFIEHPDDFVYQKSADFKPHKRDL
jgi:predicted SprT family Zn-dependent metalloprotease